MMALRSKVLSVPPGGTPSSFSLPALLCAQADRPDPTPGGGWEYLSSPSPDLVARQRYLRQLLEGVDRVDAEISRLADDVRLVTVAGRTEIEYSGQPLDESRAHLIRAADWSAETDSTVRGQLNRAVVVQFAFWSLTDNYTEEDLARRAQEEHFQAAQARGPAIRWAVQHVLEQAGFKPALFDPYAAEVVYNRGVDALRANRPQQAEQHLRLALERRPDYGPALFNLGLALAGQELWDEADHHFQAAADLLPDDAEVPYNLGALALRQNDLTEAAACFRQALELSPDHELARLWLAKCENRVAVP